MLTFTIWLLITTSPLGDVFIIGQHESLLQCLQAAAPNQECVEATVVRPQETSKNITHEYLNKVMRLKSLSKSS